MGGMQKRAVRRKRLLHEDIQRSAADGIPVDRIGKVGLIHDSAAAHVYYDSCRLHLR